MGFIQCPYDAMSRFKFSLTRPTLEVTLRSNIIA